MAVCDAHEGMAGNIEHLRKSVDQLYDLNRQALKEAGETTRSMAQLFESTAQNETNLREFKAESSAHLSAQDKKMDDILAAVSALKRRRSPAKSIAIVAASLLGGGGLASIINAVFGGVKK
jgi:ABC-type transporter Mla subunit MlaD